MAAAPDVNLMHAYAVVLSLVGLCGYNFVALVFMALCWSGDITGLHMYIGNIQV